MRFLTDRREIAKAMNFGKYPVVMFDLDCPKKGWDDVYEGTKVRLDTGKTFSDGLPWIEPCDLAIYVDNFHEGIENTVENRLASKIYIGHGATFITNSFGAEDVLNMANDAMAPMVRPGEKVIVVYKATVNGGLRTWVRVMKVSDRIDIHCSTVGYIEDVA